MKNKTVSEINIFQIRHSQLPFLSTEIIDGMVKQKIASDHKRYYLLEARINLVNVNNRIDVKAFEFLFSLVKLYGKNKFTHIMIMK